MSKGSGYIFIQHILQPLTADWSAPAPIKPLCSAVCHSQFQAIAKKCHICNNWLFCSTFMLFPLDEFYFYMFPLSSFCHHSSLVLFHKSSLLISYISLCLWQVEVNNNAERTSAAGIPSGGRHCNSTSCSRDTSFPRGSCSKDFFRSGEREET